MRELIHAVVLVILVTSPVHACSYCGLSLVNLAFPFMHGGIWVLGVWRLSFLYFQRLKIQSNPQRFLFTDILPLAGLVFGARSGGLFLYLLVCYASVCIRALFGWRDWRISKNTRVAYTSHILAGLVLTPIILHAYSVWLKQDNLDHLRFYVYPGTGQSMSLARAIAQDPNLDLSRVRDMLESDDDHEATKGFEVLRHRKSASDLIEFRDILMDIPEEEYSMETNRSPRTSVWLPLWLSSVVGHDVRTRQELLEWYEKQEKGG